MFEDLDWRPKLVLQEKGKLSRQYVIHCDPGRTGANFAMCIAHLENAPCEVCGHRDEDGMHSPMCTGSIRPHVIVDVLKVWRPMDYPDNVVDYVEVQQDLINILNHFPSTTSFSMDQWNSALFLADLKRRFSPRIRIVEETFDEKSNQNRFEKFKSALNLGWVHSFRDTSYKDDSSCLLELELTFLQEVHGKVKKQEVGPVTTKDLADCLMVVTVDLLHDALDRWYSEHLTRGSFGSSDVAGLRGGREGDRERAMSGLQASRPGTMQDRFNTAMDKSRRDQVLSKSRQSTTFQGGSHRGGRFG